jgi:2-dehydro-3-deoxyphosphogluconate aldolase/(4S)-4-hydroxy-2-oxoglutarate aldolase
MNLKSYNIVGILRNMPYDNLKQIIATASSYNIKVFEISIMNEESYDQIKYLKGYFPDLIIGAGTVTDSDILEKALKAGADFMLSPSCDESVLSECLNKGINLIPGVFTPSDVNLARKYGFKYLKLFPSDSLPLG